MLNVKYAVLFRDPPPPYVTLGGISPNPAPLSNQTFSPSKISLFNLYYWNYIKNGWIRCLKHFLSNWTFDFHNRGQKRLIKCWKITKKLWLNKQCQILNLPYFPFLCVFYKCAYAVLSLTHSIHRILGIWTNPFLQCPCACPYSVLHRGRLFLSNSCIPVARRYQVQHAFYLKNIQMLF
jgi:hypothetical protein